MNNSGPAKKRANTEMQNYPDPAQNGQQPP